MQKEKLYIDGAWVPSTATETIDVICPTSEEVIGAVPAGTPDDIDAAVRAARKAFDAWSQSSVEDRAKFLQQIHEGLQARSAEIAETYCQEVGAMPLGLAMAIQSGLPIMISGSFAQIVADFPFEEEVGNSKIVKEPVGVVGCITPWNYPLHQIINKVAPALAAGCTVVLKPSEVAPTAAYILAEIIDSAGLPPGVFNFVTGYGPIVGEALAAHPDVDMISFTGSTRAGKRVSEVAAQTVKRVHLELGGKSPNVILDDADLEKAVTTGINFAFLNAGQTCTAWTRMLVPADRQEEAVQIAKRAAETFSLGDPMGGEAKMGPLVSKAQQERVRGYIRKGVEEGATLVTGGPEQPEGLEKGFFVKPTIFSDVRNDMTIARDEIFGPVLSIIPYGDEDEAVEIANDTIYGLAAAVWSGDNDRALRVAKRIRAGQVDVNGGSFNPLAPFGGYKQSGVGRELGRWGLEEFLEIKAVQV